MSDGIPMQPQKGWFSKNWYWVVGLGCALPTLCCVVLAVASSVFTDGATKLVANAVESASDAAKNSEAYIGALAIVNDSPEVKALLGTPVQAGVLSKTNVERVNGSEKMSMTFSVTGPKGEGSVELVANKSATGAWRYSKLTLESKGKMVDLSQGDSAPSQGNTPLDADDGADEEAPPEEDVKGGN
jgi:hypothetical protein